MTSSATAPRQDPATPSDAAWTALQRFTFRVAFVYFILDALPDLLLKFPGGPTVLRLYWKIWNALLPWFGRYVLHVRDPRSLPLPTAPVLLGDFAGGYVLMLLFLALGVAGSLVWTFADRRRGDYRILHYWLRVYIRYALVCSVLVYGLGKVFPLQFAPLRLVDLVTPVGMMEPRQLLWYFMGFSRPYQVFTGLVECAGVVLLFWRRTTLLGSLLLIAAMGNVLMIDIGYGVAVRRIALRFLLMALFLTAPDLPRLARFFLGRLPLAAGAFEGPSWKGGWTGRLALAGQAAVNLYLVTSLLITAVKDRRLVAAPPPALYGVYQVQPLLGNRGEATAGNPRAWQWIAVDEHGIAAQVSGLKWERSAPVFDDAKQNITIHNGPRGKSSLNYSRTGPDDVLVKGTLDKQPTEMFLHRMPAPRFLLNDPSAMHWPSIW